MAPRQAAIDAGYAPTGADSAASNLEKRADVQKAIKEKAKPKANAKQSAGGRQSRSAKAAALAAQAEGEGTLLRPHYSSARELFAHLMNEPEARDATRMMAASELAKYEIKETAPAAGKGKKEQQEERAKEQSRNGKFARRSAPRATGITVN